MPLIAPSVWIDNIIFSILKNSTIEWWLSNKLVLELIAEASPKSYIEFIQTDLKNEASIIRDLFTPRGITGFLGPHEHYTQILFSLQAVLWDSNWLLPVSCILADLSSIKNDSNLYNL